MYYCATYPSPVGALTLCSDGENIVGLWIEGQRYFMHGIYNCTQAQSLPVLKAAAAWLDRYFEGKNPDISSLPLKPSGSEFRQRVWKLLCKIPYGTTASYGKIAKALESCGGRVSARAVGGAVAHNPISIIIPCHRVVGADGNITGYAGGIETKLSLLQHEGSDISGLKIPKNT